MKFFHIRLFRPTYVSFRVISGNLSPALFHTLGSFRTSDSQSLFVLYEGLVILRTNKKDRQYAWNVTLCLDRLITISPRLS